MKSPGGREGSNESGEKAFKGEQLGSRETGGDQYIDFTGTEWKK
jgi:hypothetical protein